MLYAYQGSGHPILKWKNGPPMQSRAADSVSLGGYVLPRAGAPEPINGLGACCSSCAGKPMGGLPMSPTLTAVAVAGALFVAYKLLKK